MKHWKKLYSTSDTFVCPYCYNTFPMSEGSLDHIKPFNRGGKTAPENLVICCKKDNNKKGMLTPDEYKLWLLLDNVRNGNKDVNLIKKLEYVMYILGNRIHKGRI